MRVLLVLLMALTLILIPQVRAQQESACLPKEDLDQVFNERNGETWVFALVEKEFLKTAVCVQKDQARLRFRSVEGTERSVQWVGTPKYGHWYHITRVDRKTLQTDEGTRRGLPPLPIIWAGIRLASNESIHVIRYTPPWVMIERPWVVEWKVTHWVYDGRTWVGKSISYIPKPTRRADGTVGGDWAFAESVITRDQGRNIFLRYTPIVLDFMEGKFFEEHSSKTP